MKAAIRDIQDLCDSIYELKLIVKEERMKNERLMRLLTPEQAIRFEEDNLTIKRLTGEDA